MKIKYRREKYGVDLCNALVGLLSNKERNKSVFIISTGRRNNREEY